MNCNEFRHYYAEYTDAPIPGRQWNTNHFMNWQQHRRDCHDCTDWRLEFEVSRRGANIDAYPCLHMAFHATFDCDDDHPPHECPETIVVYDDRFDEYAIGARGGTGDDIRITHCPWCGVGLPRSMRQSWHRALERLGLDPESATLPPEFESGAWRA